MVKDMDNLYDILQVDDKGRDIEIKKAYIKMLRRYPPEKCPEEFKKIREAYEILIEPVLKAEYNAFINYKDKIEDYRKRGNNSLNKKQYRRAIVYYKKILLIEPKLTFAKNKLGLAFFYNKQYEEAVIQFRELIQLNPHNAIFYNNLAYVYKEQKKYELAEELLLKSYDIDNTNEKTVLALGDIYIITEEYDKGIEFLTKCINQRQSDCFQQIMYYLKVLRMYVNTDNIEMVEKNLERVKRIIPHEETVKEYVIWKLQNIAQQLLQNNNYKLGNKICKKLVEIDNKNEKIIKLSNKFNELINVADSVNLLVKDCRILECLKNPIVYHLHWDNDYEKELNKKREKNIEKIKENIENNFSNVLKSIDILKKEYTILYNYKSELYEQAYKMAEYNKNADGLVESSRKKNTTVDEEKNWPVLYNININNKKRKVILKRRYYKVLLLSVVLIALLVIILNKFHLFKRI